MMGVASKEEEDEEVEDDDCPPSTTLRLGAGPEVVIPSSSSPWKLAGRFLRRVVESCGVVAALVLLARPLPFCDLVLEDWSGLCGWE